MDVLVVGGGIAGLALARSLRRWNVPVTVAERSADDSGGLAVNLPGNAIAAFAALGLAEELQKIGRPTQRREYRTRRDRLLFTVDEDAFWGPEARPRCVRRSDLLALLAEGLDTTVRRPLDVAAVRPQPDGVEVDFAGGTREHYGFVVGADGVRSTVRATGTRASLLSAASWRFMAPNPGVDCWTVWSGRGGAILLIPVDDSQVYGYASATGGGPVSADASWLHTTFANYPATVRRVLDTLTDLYHSPVEEVRTTNWSAGRCVLIGDAAHAAAPVWAQGAALAVEDGLVLAELLATVPWDEAGATYTDLRRDRIAHVRAATDRFNRAAALPPWLRDLIVPALGPRTYRDTYSRLRHPFPTP